MKTILLILLTFMNQCTSNQHKSRLIIDHNDAAQLINPIKSPNTAAINNHNEKRRLQNGEILWQVGNTRLVSVTDKFRVNTITEEEQYGISVKVLPEGNAVVYAWESWHLPQEAEAFRIFMLQMFNGGGNSISAYSQVNPNDQNAFPPLPILHTGNNQLMSVWSGEVVDEEPVTFRIYGRFFDSSGNLDPNHFLISNETWGFSSDNPDGKCQENVCVVTWNTFGPNNIYMQELYTNGTSIGDTKRVNVNVTSSFLTKVAPEVVFFRNGNFMIFWFDQRNDYTQNFVTYYDIYAQIFHKNGTMLLENDLKINTFTYIPVAGTIAADSFKKKNRIIIVWEGIRTTKTISRVYYRTITINGEEIIFDQPNELEVLDQNNPTKNQLPNRYPDVVVLIDDFYAITWSSFVDQVSQSASIAMQIFKNNTVAIGSEVNVSNETAVNTRYPKIDASGNLIAVGWESEGDDVDVWTRLLNFFTPTQSPTVSPTMLTISPTTGTPTTKSPTLITLYPTFKPTPSPTTKASVWWDKSETTFWIVMGSTLFLIGIGTCCYVASKFEAVSMNTINNLHDVELE